MTTPDLTSSDQVMELGQRVSGLIVEGYSGEQITAFTGASADAALEALTAFASRVLHGTAPSMPSPECGPGSSTDGWCWTHGVFHVGGAA